MAERVLVDFPAEQVDVRVMVPTALPAGLLDPAPLTVPLYHEGADGVLVSAEPSLLPPRSRVRERDRLAEKRAVQLATQGLEADGWVLTRDCQKDGVGYDLEFHKHGRRLKVEVKGVQASQLAFNLTPKEFWRATTDEEWVLVVVTSVLAPRQPKVHLVSRDQVVAGQRVVKSYRVRL